MEPTIATIGKLDVSGVRLQMPALLRARAQAPQDVLDAIEAGVAGAISQFDDAEVQACIDLYGRAGEGYEVYGASPMARAVARAFMEPLVPSWEVEGTHHIRTAADRGPVVLLSNHLSYVDTQAKDLLLARADADDLARRIVVVAGPKVYSEPFRRLAAISLNTLATAQSARIGHNEAGLSAREVAKIALGTVEEAGRQMRAGRLVLLYAEGTRARTGRLGSFLRAVARYLRVDGLQAVPIAISGTGEMFPIHQQCLRPAPLRLVACEPVAVADQGPAEALVAVWKRLAEALPVDLKPDGGTAPVG